MAQPQVTVSKATKDLIACLPSVYHHVSSLISHLPPSLSDPSLTSSRPRSSFTPLIHQLPKKYIYQKQHRHATIHIGPYPRSTQQPSTLALGCTCAQALANPKVKDRLLWTASSHTLPTSAHPTPTCSVE